VLLDIQKSVRAEFVKTVREAFGLEVAEPAIAYPPSLDMGELSIAACFELAKSLRRPPRKIAEEIAARFHSPAGVERVSVAAGGYLNFHLDRARLAQGLFAERLRDPRGVAASDRTAPQNFGGKILVEHTSINPNKAAHIGHLRNAVLGDTFARLLAARGAKVEIQNYIDNTGVQVADVIVGFERLERKTTDDVRRLIADSSIRFDYYCWDLYARVFHWYESEPAALAHRAETLHAIEEGRGDTAAMADLVSTAIVRLHLETMRRVNVEYDLLAQESEILRLDFWAAAFALLKKKRAIRHEERGKNRGCWVMDSNDDAESGDGASDQAEDAKVIVRSNGTVTYVGKDIAYHLWKFGLLGKDFGYRRLYDYPSGRTAWRTASAGEPDAPPFGGVHTAYAVIDARQSYVQSVVAAAFRALSYEEQAENLHHFAYEVVGLTPACAKELGVELTDEDRGRPYIEVSGRKGLGIKADDLIDRLIKEALEEVRARKLTEDPAEQAEGARRIAVGALRYFLLKFSRRVIIAFDFKEALAFEGETGPYLQYTVVRARNIFRKYQEIRPGFEPEKLGDEVAVELLGKLLIGEAGRDFWELVLLASQIEAMADQAIASEEPTVVAKFAFRLAQAFNNFYHHHHILSETDTARQSFLLYVVYLVERSLALTLDLLGIEVPERM
jgi:arginyl-tRNA synthetase